ncbi:MULTISPECIES: 4Fe-4S binding protein [unclassified Lebetimonas]|uniref:4Fe-4S binding protein n=2 Tax=Lebetimonas TaxID=267989 RepID=UPI000465EBEA|nr:MULTISPECIES: 4Fe-4S binding protein [unclassified Lebetimonas]
MLFQISERVLRVLKAITEPREAIKDVVKEPAHKSSVFRGKHNVRYDICTGCDACNKICPVDAIKMKPLPIKRPNKVPEVNLAICIFCGLCEDVCPTKPEKAIKLSGGDIEMITHDGTHDTLENFWVRVDVPEEWIEKKKKEEEEKARKKAEMLAKKKAEAEAKKKAEAEAKKQESEAPKGEEK